MVREKAGRARPLTEFELIERFFARRARAQPKRITSLGIGDDCALIPCAEGMQLAISTDMLVEGRHFFANAEPRALGHKSLAVNLSDLAAMGAAPRAFTLALALPQAREEWLAPFSEGLFALADQYECELIGGDTTAGPRTICITILGDLNPEHALRRDAARAGDDVWVSGLLGDARLALGGWRDEWRIAEDDWPQVQRALDWPQPRIALGRALAGIAHAAIDLSDGLAGDLMHLLTRSNVSAVIDIDRLPRSAALARMPPEIQQRCTLSGGDDYELCFTAPAAARVAIAEIGARLSLPLTRIGTILAFDPSAARIRWQDASGAQLSLSPRSFDHFRSNDH